MNFFKQFIERVNFVTSNILCFLFRSCKNVVCIVRMEMSKEPQYSNV